MFGAELYVVKNQTDVSYTYKHIHLIYSFTYLPWQEKLLWAGNYFEFNEESRSSIYWTNRLNMMSWS